MDAIKIIERKEKNILTAGKILLADNDSAAKVMLYIYFYNRGYEIERAADVTDMIAKLLNKDIGVIIIDAEFYGTKTYNLLRIIRRIDPEVKVIFTSNKSSIEDIAEAREAGIFFHAAKPFNFEELNMAIKQTKKYNGGE